MRSLVVGASGGIGSALAEALGERGEVVRLSRREDGLDVRDEASVERCLGTLQGEFDLILCAVGILAADTPPEKSIAAVTADSLTRVFEVNAAGPMLVLKHALRLLPKDRPATFAALSARVGSIGDNRIGGWHSYRASKAALNMLMHGAAIELARTHRQATLLCLHPGTVETPFTEDYTARHKTVPPAEAAANLLAVLDRLGPEESGGFFDQHGRRIDW
ncbi:SDR family NAD(P)-dependent oxidoreductase [Tropicimonas sp. IMCC34011]|uniref:SDR family NAD(P)-dependent oxidoreductase n=1 Tax=Tropicimonas sp. IMCC34011 TaxID=2248759 RepID=UPI000E234795|nr:SDR family NAD(P)-dependent oxidoreductase [Tropicimonas sp. IMCC34011]